MQNKNLLKKQILVNYIHPKFWLFLPVFVTIGGILIVLITRYLAYVFNPEVFSRSLTTISNTAAFEYASQFFASSMSVIALCIMLVWYVGHLANKNRIALLSNIEVVSRLGFINKITLILGIISCLFLILLSLISLKDNNPLHIAFSYGFFITQTLAFVLDTTLLFKIRKYLKNSGHKHDLRFDMRPWVCIAFIINALLFYFLYLYKGSPLLANFSFTQSIYIISEYSFVFIGLMYASAYRTELRHYVNNLYGTAYN